MNRPAHHSAFEVGLAYASTRVRVASTSRGDVAWLAEFLAPHFEDVPVEGCESRVALSIDEGRHAQLLAAGPRADGAQRDAFGLDTSVVRLPVWSTGPEGATVFDESAGVFCSVSAGGRQVELLASRPSGLVRLHLMRVVRELAMDEVSRQGLFLLHAAAMERDGRGLVIAGAKGAGKTTLLASLLRQPGVRYVSNDRVVLGTGQPRPTLRGLPTLVMIRDGTLDLLPALRGPLGRLRGGPFASREEAAACADAPVAREGRFALSPPAFCALLDVAPLAECATTAVVFPRLAAGAVAWETRRLTAVDAAARLHATRFGAGATKAPPPLFGPPGAPHPDAAAVDRVVADIAAQVACYECRLGPDAHARPETMAALLERLTAGD